MFLCDRTSQRNYVISKTIEIISTGVATMVYVCPDQATVMSVSHFEIGGVLVFGGALIDGVQCNAHLFS